MFKKQKVEWIYLLVAMIAIAALSASAVFAYFNVDRWAAFGTIGTWLTGGAAAFIAYIQYNEQKLRKAELSFRAIADIKHNASVLLFKLERQIYTINKVLELSLHAGKSSVPDSVRKEAKTCMRLLSEAQGINTEQIKIEYLPQPIDATVRDLNFAIEILRSNFTGTHQEDADCFNLHLLDALHRSIEILELINSYICELMSIEESKNSLADQLKRSRDITNSKNTN